jgi:hypothetical protein
LDEHAEKWYEEGQRAFVDGKKAVDCRYLDTGSVTSPYTRMRAVDYWNAGWMDALHGALTGRVSWPQNALDIPVGEVNPGAQKKGRAIDVGT